MMRSVAAASGQKQIVRNLYLIQGNAAAAHHLHDRHQSKPQARPMMWWDFIRAFSTGASFTLPIYLVLSADDAADASSASAESV